MDGQDSPKMHFKRALKRISAGTLCKMDLYFIQRHLKEVHNANMSGTDAAEEALVYIDEIANSFNRFMHQRVLLMLPKALDRRIKSIARKMKLILKRYSAYGLQDNLLKRSKGGLFHLAVVDPQTSRIDQISILKSLISDLQFNFSPVFVWLIAPLLRTITCQEFTDYIFQDALRLLKRGQRDIAFSLFTLSQHLNKVVMLENAIEIIDNLKGFLTIQDENTSVFGGEKMSIDQPKHKGIFSHIVSELIHLFSKMTFRGKHCGITNYVQGLMEDFNKGTSGGLSNQETNAILILLLLPECDDGQLDTSAFSGFVDTSRTTIKKIVKSHPFESVQILFIQIAGRLMYISDDADIESFLIDMLEGMVVPLVNATKGKEIKLNDKLLYSILYALRVSVSMEKGRSNDINLKNDQRLGQAATQIIQFCHDRPVYKNCLFEASYLHMHLSAHREYKHKTEKESSLSAVKKNDTFKGILDAMQPHSNDPLSHMILCRMALEHEHINLKGAEGIDAMLDSTVEKVINIANVANPGNIYATMLQLYDDIRSRKNHLKHPFLKCFYACDYVESIMKEFLKSIREHHLFMMLIALMRGASNTNVTNSLSMLRDVWLSLNCNSHIFTVLVHCILFRHRLDGFESSNKLVRLINIRKCKKTGMLKPVLLKGHVVEELVYHCLSEGSIPYILEHYLAVQNPDISHIMAKVLDTLKNTLEALKQYEKEDFEIYFAPADKLYMDSRAYQPNLNQIDKRKFSNLTKQQLDEMRYKDQCIVRMDIAHLVKKVNVMLYIISRGIAHSSDYLKCYLKDILITCKGALIYNVVHPSFYLLLEILCIKCLVGDIFDIAGSALKILAAIYSKQMGAVSDEEIMNVFNRVRDSGAVAFEGGTIIAEIVTHVLKDGHTGTQLREIALIVLLKFQKAGILLEQDALIEIISANRKNVDLHDVIRENLKQAAENLLDVDGIAALCKIGLSSTVEIVREAVSSYICRYPDALTCIAEPVKMMGLGIGDATCDVKKVMDLVPLYIDDNSEILQLAPNVFVTYPTDVIMTSLIRAFNDTDDDGRKALLRVMKYYFESLDTSVNYPSFFDTLISITGNSLYLLETLECLKAISQNVHETNLEQVVEHIKAHIESNIITSGNKTIERLPTLQTVKLGACVTFLGYLQEKGNNSIHIRWELELLLSLMGSENEFSKVEGGTHTAGLIASHARKCALSGEEELVNDNITKLFESSSSDEFAILPCVSLLKGGGLSYLKKHDVIAQLKDSLGTKEKSIRLKFLKELARQFGRLLEPYVKEVFLCLISRFTDYFELCKETCFTVIGSLTPVGLKSILPVIYEVLGGYVYAIKLGCLMILEYVINDEKLRPVVIKNICDVVKAVSPCTTDTQKAVKEAADGVLDSIVGHAGKKSILYPTMHSILKVLSHPSDVNVTNTMRVLSEYADEHPIDEHSSIHAVGTVELGLLEPILSRALRSRNGDCRESATRFSSWLVYQCCGYREVELFFSTLLPNLTDLLKDTLPEVRREAARAIGSCANSFKNFSCETSKALIVDLINRLMKCLMESITSLERCSAASGLAEALWAVDEEFLRGITMKLLTLMESDDSTPQMREGCLSVFNFLPSTCNQYMVENLDEVLSRVVLVLCDPDERVRNMSCQVLATIIEKYHSTSTDVLLKHLKNASMSREWQRRNLVLPLLQRMNTLKEDQRVLTELYISRYDQNTTVKNTATVIWKGINVTRCLRQMFPMVLQRVIEMLEQDYDEDLRKQAGECISDAIMRLGSNAIDDFIQALLTGEGAYKGRCIGIASLASNGRSGLERHLTSVLEFLKSCLCNTVSCHEASMALAALASYFPAVVSDVLPSLVQDLFSSKEKETYIVGITLLIESHRECFDIILQEVLRPELDITRLMLLEKVLCAKKTKIVFTHQHVLVNCIKQLLVYHKVFPTEVISSFSSFACLVKSDAVVRLMQVLIEMLHDITAGYNDATDKGTLLVFASRVLELREADIDTNYGSITDSLSRCIFTDVDTMEGNYMILEQLTKSAERSGNLDSVICAIFKFLSTLHFSDGDIPQTTFPHTLPLIMTFIQKCLVKSTTKIEAAKCLVVVQKLAGNHNIGAYTLKTIGAIIRCLNDKCPSPLKIALLEAMNSLLHCDAVHLRVILFQLQSVLFKCISDVNSDINLLVPQSLRLYVQLAPNKADAVLADLFQLATDTVGKATVKTAAIHGINEVLKASPALTSSPFDELLQILRESSGADRQLACNAMGLAVRLDGDFGNDWLHTLFLIIHEDPSALTVLTSIVASDQGFSTLYQSTAKELVDVLKQSLRSEVPSIKQCGLAIFCGISRRTRNLQAARDFVKAHLSMLPSGSKLAPNCQSQILQIYKRLLRFERKLPNFGSQLQYLSEAIYDTPMVKLEAEKVLLVLLGPSRDLSDLINFLKQYSTSEKVEKVLTEYSTRVLLKTNKTDQLSEDES